MTEDSELDNFISGTEYHRAKDDGQKGKDCALSHPRCPISLLNMISDVDFI